MARKNAKGNNDEEMSVADKDIVEKSEGDEGDQLKIDDKEEEILLES